MKQLAVTHAELLALIDCDPTIGICHWRIRPNNRVPAGSRVGNVCRGYWNIKFRGTTVGLHRVIWFYVHGEWPSDFIDHIDCNPSNNAISNLRVVTNQENCQNKRKAQANNALGLLGVSPDRATFRAVIGVNGRKHYLGNYKTPELAYASYLEAKRRLHAACTL